MRTFYGLDSGDGVGNRKSQKETQIPHDAIGNYTGPEERAHEIPDNLGNSIDSAPTHQLNSAYRKKSEQAPHQRMGRYIIGGVNPVVAGLSHLIPAEAPAQQAEKPGDKQDKNDKRLKRLFDFDDEGSAEFTLTSTPEEKRAQTELALKTIFEAAESTADIAVTLDSSNDKPIVSATLKSALFKPEELPTAALGFLVNKIVNKMPNDRIRLTLSHH